MRPTFDQTVSILVKAYLNDTLKHQDCSCCAVGNIISEACGYKREVIKGRGYWTKGAKVFDPQEWIGVFGTNVIKPKRTFLQKLTGSKPKRKVESWFDHDKINETVEGWSNATGYSIIELARIESAFERAPSGSNKSEWMFNGLMAVVDVLADIHGISLEAKEEAKLLFVK